MEQPMVPLGDAVPHRHEPSSTPFVYDDFRLSIRPVLSTGRTIRPAFHGDFAHTASSQSLNGGADESFPFGPFDYATGGESPYAQSGQRSNRRRFVRRVQRSRSRPPRGADLGRVPGDWAGQPGPPDGSSRREGLGGRILCGGSRLERGEGAGFRSRRPGRPPSDLLRDPHRRPPPGRAPTPHQPKPPTSPPPPG